ncbi:MAG: carbon-nitrogen hydrolase family protein [Gammaproteobacteria bacterium]|nr:carbon-nitrogen hydrolase family protein [Gammaproteobacteria bacterium]
MKSARLNQLKVSWISLTACADVQQNLAQVSKLLSEVEANQPDVLVLPEAFAWLSSNLMAQQAHTEVLGDSQAPLQSACAQWARQLNAYVVAGSLPLTTGDHVYATLCIFDPHGVLVTYYRKMHLFSVVTPTGASYREDRLFREGPVPVIWHSPWGAIGLAICYDLRFPAMFRYYAQAGARLVLLPSAFTAETGEAHWHVLVRARAIETQSFMLAVNQVGQHDERLQTYGHSLLVDPWGQVLQDTQLNTGVFSAEIDLNRVDQLRHQFPVLQTRSNGMDEVL